MLYVGSPTVFVEEDEEAPPPVREPLLDDKPLLGGFAGWKRGLLKVVKVNGGTVILCNLGSERKTCQRGEWSRGK